MDYKKLLPHAIAIAVMLAVAAIFFAPNAFYGKLLPQGDNVKARGMQTETKAYLDKEGTAPLWTNAAFGGMPSFQIYQKIDGNLTKPVYKAMFLGQPITSVWAQVFAAMLCMYLLMLVLRVDWRVAIFAALTYGITSYNVDILEAGHSTKMNALAMMPGVFAGLILLYREKWLLGAGVFALFLTMQINANHVQITYYTLLLCAIYGAAALADAIKAKSLANWAKASAISLACLILGFGSNISRLWPTYEFSKETIRGKSELTQKSSKGDGLDKDYLFGWSYGIGESLTLLVPHAYGGGANESFEKTKFFDLVSRGTSTVEKKQIARQIASSFYWGNQPFVGTAIYFGAIVVFLALMGAFLVPGRTKWWLVAGGIFTLTLAWGKNFFLNDILYDVLPMFNKFRAVSMALGISQMCFAILAALGIQQWFNQETSVLTKQRALYIALGSTVLLCLIAGFGGVGSGANDAALAKQINMPNLSQILEQDRAALARSDAFRSLGFILAAAAVLWFSLRGTLKAGMAVIIMVALALADHWGVATRTKSSDDYQDKRIALGKVPEQPYDAQIKADPDPHYRVLDLARGGITGNAFTSYYHKSLSGYSAAKLQRFQEVVDTFLTTNLGENLHIIGMLNGKYIVTQKGEVVQNPEVCGNAWFVEHFTVVPDGNAEIAALHNLNPKDSAVVQQSFAEGLNGLNIQRDSNATIKLTSYHPDKMEYTYSASSEQLALFSEMYYPPAKGWQCYLNGEPAPDFIKANYLIRAMRLPPGQNMKLEMRFEPRSFYLGEKLSMVFSLLVLLLFAVGVWFWYKKGLNMPPANLDNVPQPEQHKRAPEPQSIVKKGKKK